MNKKLKFLKVYKAPGYPTLPLKNKLRFLDSWINTIHQDNRKKEMVGVINYQNLITFQLERLN